MIESIMVDFCSIEGCYSGWWVWDLRKLTQFLGSEMSPGLFENFMDERMKHQNSTLLQLNVAKWLCLRVRVQEDSSSIPVGSQFLIPVLPNLCSETVKA